MKKLFIYLFTILSISFASCKGNKTESNQADTGQAHVGNEGPTDSAALSTTPVETGGKDTSGNGYGTRKTAKDTLKSNPK
jgi:hypothetical protein